MSILDDAIERLRYHALATKYDGTNTIKTAPETPPESGGSATPFAVTYINGGRAVLQSYDTVRFFANIAVEFHFDISRLKTAFQQINTVVPDFTKRLAGDPTLNGKVSTISEDITIAPVAPYDWGQSGASNIYTLMVRFTVPVKYLETPTT